jgi:hypothetical protein
MEEKKTLSHFTLRRFHVRITSTTKGLLQPVIYRVADMDAHGTVNVHIKTKNYTTPDRLQRLAS